MAPNMLCRGVEASSMTKRFATAIALVLTLAPASAFAQIRQVSSSSSDHRNTVNFSIGYFGLKGLESRADRQCNGFYCDVLAADLLSAQPLLFQVKDLNSAAFGGEYLVAISRNLEVGVGLGFAQRTAPSVYSNLTHSNGDEIVQDIKLRQIPVTFTARYVILPIGSAVEPYVGGGLTAIRYQYSEVGEFIDDVGKIFPASYKADGVATGPVVLAGVRAPVSNWTVGGELRWQKARAKNLLSEGFLSDELDLGGWQANFTFGVRF
jgi:opacity protein-like surface antigen